MGRYTPVIATDIGALPEFVEDQVNGILLPLDKNEIGEWKYEGRTDRHLSAYERMFRDEVNRLAETLFQKFQACVQFGRTACSVRASSETADPRRCSTVPSALGQG